jgi:hypothetical protein
MKGTTSLRVRVVRGNKDVPIFLSMMVSDDHGIALTYRTESALFMQDRKLESAGTRHGAFMIGGSSCRSP